MSDPNRPARGPTEWSAGPGGVRFRLVLAIAVLIPLAAVGLLAGLTRPFYQVYDNDLYYLYQALRLVEGLPQMSFDHTGYLCMLLLSWWVELMGLIHAVQTTSLSEIRGAADGLSRVADLIVTARVYSILLTAASCWLFGAAAARLARHAGIGLIAGLVLATSIGYGYHALIVRPELPSALGVMAAYLAVALAGETAGARRYVWLGAAAAAAYLGMLAKVQAIIPLLLLPLFALTIAPSPPEPAARAPGETRRALILLFFAGVVFLPFLIAHYFGADAQLDYAGVPFYALATIAYLPAAVALHAWIHGEDRVAVARACAALTLGLTAGFAFNYFHFRAANPGWIADYVDRLKLYTAVPALDTASYGSFLTLLELTVSRVPSTVEMLFLRRPMTGVPMLLAAIGAAAFLAASWRARRWSAVAGPLLLLGGAAATVLAFRLRGFRPEYDAYFYFMPLLAVILAFAKLPGPTRRRVAPALLVLGGLLAAGQLAVNLQPDGIRATVTGIRSDADFCAWQREDAPFLELRAYDGGTCLGAYRAARSRFE